jgi:8-oxo-dGTP diphosphatase
MIYVVAAFINHNHSFLLARRAYGNLKGYWEFPGGKVHRAEKPFDALKREIKEELNLDIVPKKVIGSFTHEYSFAKVHLTLISCVLASTNHKIVSDGSHSKRYPFLKTTSQQLFS